MKLKRSLAAAAIAAGALGSLVAVQSPALAAGCKPEIVTFSNDRVWHADCKTGSGTIRVVITIRSPNGASYAIYGPWVNSTKPSQSSTASADKGLNVVSVTAQLK